VADLNEISIFVRVAQLGSFSAAARSLGAPVSTVSRKVAELESRLGVQLIKRTTRKLNLSEFGLRFYENCAPPLQALDDAEAGLAEQRVRLQGVLHVTAPVALGTGEFIAFVSSFLLEHPDLKVDLVITNQFVDLIATQVDVAIRFGELSDSGVIAKRLGVSRRVLVASPSYLKKRGTPRSPAELSSHECVLFLGKTGGTEWNLQHGKLRARVGVKGHVSANNFESASQFAVRGHGVALIPEHYAVAGAAAGVLERVLPRWTSAPIPVHAVFLNRKFVPAKLQSFLSALSSWKNSTWRKDVRSKTRAQLSP
jgi:DNA-binding transcriptional LysR family regulator